MLLRELAHRASPTIGASTSQVLSALSNVVVVVAVGRGSGAAGLGRYTLAFGAYVIVLGLSRALVSQPLLTLRGKLGAGDPSMTAAATATGWLGAAGGAVCTLVGIGLRRPELVMVGLFMVPLCLQDLLRFAFFQTSRPWGATLLDAVWLVVSLATFPIIASRGSPVLATTLWGAGAMVAAVPGLLIMRVRATRTVQAYRWWLSEARHLGIGLTLESIAYSLGSQASLWAIVAVLGDGDLGRLKAAQTVLGPATMVLSGFTMLAIPRMAQSAEGQSLRSALGISRRALALVGAVSAAMVWMGPKVARILFGSDLSVNWSLLLPVAVQVAATALAVGPVTALMVQRRGGTMAAVRAISAAIGVVAVAVACAPLGIVGAAWGFVLGSLLFTLGTAAVLPAHPTRSEGRGVHRPASR